MAYASIREEVYIEQPPEKICDFLLDPSQHPGVLPGLESVTDVSQTPLAEGGSFQFSYSMLGIPIHGTWMVSRLVYPRIYEGVTSGGAVSNWKYELFPMPKGTQVVLQIEYDPPESVISKIKTNIMQQKNQEEAHIFLENIKILLEQHKY